ncbi:HtaA domain-containing protein [Pseudonocardia broussonetiae]|uniref:Htaa domain-containing protein n=1 Tax=Pseudonocardia broussonetiae TaxID=2736640 RepID=A0A6M6JEE6_9PSEU|nr:HtaA domain-containing protein [Pseudonocardia broussonetiae]QJY44779.1 hypothetical protein HOP40_02100 [Pseudonocardia broussonetiae]
MRIRQVLTTAATVAAISLGSLAAATPAIAAPAAPTHARHDDSAVSLHGGRTTLRLDAGTAGVLADNGVSVTAREEARGEGTRFSFPIVGGSVVPSTAAGEIEHVGGLTFTAGDVTLGVEDFVIDTVQGVLTARVSGTDTRVPLLDLDASGASIRAGDDRLTVRGVRATLTDEAAAALNSTFGVDLFAGGLPIGTATVRARV